MNPLPLLTAVSRIARRLTSGLLLAGAVLAMVSSARAQQTLEPSKVIYSQGVVELQGIIPFTQTYSIVLTSPATLTPGVSVPVTFAVTPLSIPTGVLPETAVSYVTLNPAAPVFTQPNQAQTIVVTYAIPATAVEGGYGMKIVAEGFPVPPEGLENLGTQINAVAAVSALAYAPPAVVIANPADASVISVPVNSMPVTVPFAFTATSTGTAATTTAPAMAASAITELTAQLDGATVALTGTTGLGTTSASATGSLVIQTLGAHSVTAQATNLGGVTTDVSQFTVVVTAAAPPTVVIASPTVNSVYTYRAGTTPTVVPFTFTATSSFGGIKTLTAKVDGVEQIFSITYGAGNLTASGTIVLPYTVGGPHTVSVDTTDDNGTAAATSNFTVNVVAPTPTIAISQPLSGATLPLPTGATSLAVPYAFTTTSNNGFFVDSVSASLDGNPIVLGATTGLGTASATSTGTLLGVTAGTHTLVATGISAGIVVTTSTSFTVTSLQTPPTVVINTPAAGASYTRTTTGAALCIPLTFTGTSTAANAVITELRATLNGTALPVTSTTLNQRVAHGAATLTVSAAGTYTISVTAIDAVGTASAVRTFSVVVLPPRRVYGSIFFDVDCDGNYDSEDYHLAGIPVKVFNASNAVVASTVTDCDGGYSLGNLTAGTYRVVPTPYAGLKLSTVTERTVTVAGVDVCVPRIGVFLDFAAIRPMTANGCTIGFWKNNLEKAISGDSKGCQVSKSKLTSYTSKIGSFALPPHDSISMKTAVATMAYTGSTPALLLSKQLLASQYNYQNEAYIGGNQNLTMCFLWWAEYVMANPGKYSSTDILRAKDWCDAYNNSHGGAVNGPR